MTARVRLGLLLVWFGAFAAVAADAPSVTDSEVWNEGVTFYREGDVTNALRVLKPLMLSKSHGARAAEVVAKLEYDAKNLENAAVAAQIALRRHPDDPRANRNFTRAVDRLPELREEKHVAEVLKAAQGKDPSSLMLTATAEARALMTESATYRTNGAARTVALADSLSARARKLADAWLPVKESISQSVTNETQAATILEQLAQAQEKTKKAAKELGDLDENGYSTMSDVEHDYTRFLKLMALPPVAIAEDLTAQSNAWMDVEAFNDRSWQQDALDYTRAFRAKFPAWARAYEQQAQADTNKPPFTAEDQAKIAALATELEKMQMSCTEEILPPKQEEAVNLIRQIQDLLPKDKNGGGQNAQPPPPNQQNQKNDQQNKDNRKNDAKENEPQDDQRQDQDPQADEGEKGSEGAESPETDEPKEDLAVDAILKKAQERNDEHEAEKRARMRKAKLPPNERDW